MSGTTNALTDAAAIRSDGSRQARGHRITEFRGPAVLAGRHVDPRAPHGRRRRAVRAPGGRDPPRAGRHRGDAQPAGCAARHRLRSGPRLRPEKRTGSRRSSAWPRAKMPRLFSGSVVDAVRPRQQRRAGAHRAREPATTSPSSIACRPSSRRVAPSQAALELGASQQTRRPRVAPAPARVLRGPMAGTALDAARSRTVASIGTVIAIVFLLVAFSVALLLTRLLAHAAAATSTRPPTR